MLVQKINEPGSLRTSGAIHMKLAEYDQLTGGIGFPREKGTDRTRPVRTPFRTFFRTLFPSRFWILLIALQCSCNPSDSYKFEGKWQSLNSPGSVVAFTPDKKMIFYKDKVSLWVDLYLHHRSKAMVSFRSV